MRETSALSKGKRKKKKRTAKHSPLLTRGLQVDGCSRVHGDDLKKNPPTPPLAKKQLNTFLEPPWRLRAGGYSRVCHAQISTWSRGSRVFFRQVKRARAAHHRSFNRTEVSSPASQRSRYFHHHFNLPPPVQPPPLAISTSTFPSLTPPSLTLSLSLSLAVFLSVFFSCSLAASVSAVSLQSSSPSRSSHSTVCQLASTPSDARGQFDIHGYHRYNFHLLRFFFFYAISLSLTYAPTEEIVRFCI